MIVFDDANIDSWFKYSNVRIDVGLISRLETKCDPEKEWD
jgi:hypothetical protein